MITFSVTEAGAYRAYGLSTDIKPAPSGLEDNCCVFFEIDTGKIFASQGTGWMVKNSGGAGGGASGSIPFTTSAGSSAPIPLSGGGIQFTLAGGGTVSIPLG